MTAPLISVVMPTWNGAALIGETLNSVSAQTLGDFEVLVVDDCSTDGTRDLVSAWPDRRVRLLTMEQNGGPVLARNRAVAEARGRFIVGLDHDDLCSPHRFARQVAFLDKHPEVVLVGTQADYLCEGVISPSGYPAVTTPALIEWLTAIENPLAWSSTMIRADAARALTPFTRPEIVYAEDFDLYHRLLPLGLLARLDEPLVTYRQHPGGVSRRFTTVMRSNAARVLAAAHAPVLGDEAGPVGEFISAHVMGGEPVPDRTTLIRLGSAIGALQRHFVSSHSLTADDLRLIRWETAARWARIGRAGLRAGTLTVSDVLAARPDHLGLGYAGLDALLWSGAIGGVRRVRAAGGR